MRVFAMSNWTELDVWEYIMLEKIPVVSLYLAKQRPVVRRNGALIMVDDERLPLLPGETPEMKMVQFRTLGCYPLSGATKSDATTIEEIVEEMKASRVSEHHKGGSLTLTKWRRWRRKSVKGISDGCGRHAWFRRSR